MDDRITETTIALKIFIYCQHVWGLGHVFRILEIARALKSHDVILVTGGPAVEIPLPVNVRRVQLPVLRMLADKQLVADDDRGLDDIWAERMAVLHALFRAERPDVFIVELYPLGRTAFGRELDPLLASIRSGRLPRCRVYCSVRDILVAKRDPQAYEARVSRKLNRWFDALLVHADPRLIRLDDTFSTVAAIEIPVVYTGYVARPVTQRESEAQAFRLKNDLQTDEKLIVVSAGGGQSGYPLMTALLAAQGHLAARLPVRMAMFTGPYISDTKRAALQAAAGPGVLIQGFATDFGRWMAAADLSVSMAGYNTCMDLLANQVPAMVWPFDGDREQPLRAARLADRGWVSVLKTADLETEALAARIEQALTCAPRTGAQIDLQGASRTASYVEQTPPLRPGCEGGA